MLPGDRKAAKEEVLAKLHQSSLDMHLQPMTEGTQKPAPYTDALMQDAAIQWLIETDQVNHNLTMMMRLI